MPIDYNDQISLVQAVEQIKPPAAFLLDTFFPKQAPIAVGDTVLVETRRKGREVVCPFIIEGSRGVEIGRSGSTLRFYSPPMMAVRRVITQRDIHQRMFGEQPIFSTMTPQERAARLQAEDLVDLLRLIANKKNYMAAEILQTGKTIVEGLADDGQIIRLDTIDFQPNNIITPTTPWSTATAPIFDDLQDAVDRIAEERGVLPTLMVCGRNVARYLRENKQILDWLLVPNRQSLTMASIAPRYTSPQTQFIGRIDALGLDVVSYLETYIDDQGAVKSFLDPDTAIVAVPGEGSQAHAAITLIDDGETHFQTYATAYVPQYTATKASNTMELAIFSKFMLVPDWISSWLTIKSCG